MSYIPNNWNFFKLKKAAKKIAKLLLKEKLAACVSFKEINSIYEWNYSRQILQIRMMEVEGKSDQESISSEIFGSKFSTCKFTSA